MLGLLYFLLALAVWRGVRRLTDLGAVPPIPPELAPMVSIIVPVRNEAGTVRPTVERLLRFDYPRYEVIVVDGDSTDGTAEVLRALADPRLRVLHVAEVPQGWVAKSYQLSLGAREAAGEWLLFLDAGVACAPDVLARTLHYVHRHPCDQVTVLPHLITRGVPERVFLAGFLFMFLVFSRPWHARNPRSRALIGVGPFNLIRKAVYDRADGHRPVSLQIADDVALGWHLKRHGCRQDCLTNTGRVRLRWYEGFWNLLHGLEKNAFGSVAYRPTLVVLTSLFLLLVTWLPAAALVGIEIPGLRFHPLSAWLTLVSLLWLYRTLQRITHVPWYYGLAHPLAISAWCLALWNSMWVTLRRRGVAWRGRFYPLLPLRRQRPVSLKDLFW